MSTTADSAYNRGPSAPLWRSVPFALCPMIHMAPHWEATGAPTQEPEYAEVAAAASVGPDVFWPESDKSRGLGRASERT
jgi:hypothetical protein